jgi:hypothetical protein
MDGQFAISFDFAALRTLRAELTRPKSATAENFRPLFKLQDGGSLPRRLVCQKMFDKHEKILFDERLSNPIYAVKNLAFLR